ncbi:hypothetical protein HAX54_040965, partial [Datura stramonium]|nr:hypothetical protein [Datura stramonium]
MSGRACSSTFSYDRWGNVLLKKIRRKFVKWSLCDLELLGKKLATFWRDVWSFMPKNIFNLSGLGNEFPNNNRQFAIRWSMVKYRMRGCRSWMHPK